MSSRTRDYIPQKFLMDLLNRVDVRDIPIRELQVLFAHEVFTCAEYTQYCINRIQKINDSLAAVIEINSDAIRVAKKMDEERRQGGIRGMLHGIPVLVNDVRPPLETMHFSKK
ncbi:MAG: hypothetical protein OHK93_006672 [Ramalina farinacea]|uniref:Amidase domain-containing protein n=1 Tax=Ramalina farinacea TaxID=258253 RepID=A0AA43QMH5_9LECA|nr:hypothetical protein [Ramalina farinacea]